jgi:hypothetical protein
MKIIEIANTSNLWCIEVNAYHQTTKTTNGHTDLHIWRQINTKYHTIRPFAFIFNSYILSFTVHMRVLQNEAVSGS